MKDGSNNFLGSFTVDVEDWFHVLDCKRAPSIREWDKFSIRFDKSLIKILEALDRFKVRGTFFWLGWLAERFPSLVKECYDAGHEIGSHGYGHVLAYKVGQKNFRDDVSKGKKVLEEILGKEIVSFRAPGFGVKDKSLWALEEIKKAGFLYDSSIFPGARSHGGIKGWVLGPHIVRTIYGDLFENPVSFVEALGKRVCLFSGGYFRVTPPAVLKWGIKNVFSNSRPIVFLVHPREVDPGQPRLPLPFKRRIKTYIGLKGTLKKIEFLLHKVSFVPFKDLGEKLLGSGSMPIIDLKEFGF